MKSVQINLHKRNNYNDFQKKKKSSDGVDCLNLAFLTPISKNTQSNSK